jgi:GrpB-like predicted nucleotidyltransferase (UPF0157 family)
VREAARISDALGALTVELHHIGSTAVPGIVAKPVIDMLAVVISVEMLDAHVHADLKQALARAAANMEAYTEGKTIFIRDVERKAVTWRAVARRESRPAHNER